MPRAECTTFAQNAWKKDLCSNCFRTESEHSRSFEDSDDDGQAQFQHKLLGGQDSLTDLQQGTNRYLTLANNPFTPQSRKSKQINKWNEVVFDNPPTSSTDDDIQTGVDELDAEYPAINNKLQETLDSLDKAGGLGRKIGGDESKIGGEEMTVGGEERTVGGNEIKDGGKKRTMEDPNPSSHSVIERLDSLVMGTPVSSPDHDKLREKTSDYPGILKDVTRDRSADIKRNITFPDYEELQEIIGYGGECYYSSEEEEEEPRPRPQTKPEFPDTELTEQERNTINMTRKNTMFNSHAPNLKERVPPPQVKLGQEKKHTPVISVRPFVREQTPGKVNMVSPMINGEVVKPNKPGDNNNPKPNNNNPVANPANSNSSLKGRESVKSSARETSSSSSLIQRKLSEDGSGRGEVKTMKTDSLGSDGSTENSSDSDSNMRDSPPPHHHVTSFNGIIRETADRDESPVRPSLFLPPGPTQQQDKKSSAAVARLSNLDKSKSLLNENRGSTKLSLSVHSSSQPTDRPSSNIEPLALSETVERNDVSAARLSFLSCTVNGAQDSDPDMSDQHKTKPPRPNSSSDNEADSPAPTSSSDHSQQKQPKNSAEKVELSVESSPKVTRETPKLCSPADSKAHSPKDSPKVKLTRKSPYVLGRNGSTAILKGTPKPIITRKPAILKDKPKVPLKPNKLILRSPSSSPSPHDKPRASLTAEPAQKTSSADAPAPKRVSNLVRKGPVAAPRTSSFRARTEYVNLSVAPGSETKLSSPQHPAPLNVENDTGKETEPPADLNSLIIAVSSRDTNQKTSTNNPSETCSSPDTIDTTHQDIRTQPSPPQVQKKLADKNKEALEAIRKSLSNKLISGCPPPRVVESIKASTGSLDFITHKSPVEKKVSNSFEETRAALEESLHFSRHEKAAPVNSSKRQAPGPPPSQEEEVDTPREEEAPQQQEPSTDELILGEEEEEEAEVEQEIPATPKLTPAIRNSSMKSEVANKPNKLRSVQFSPDTHTVTVPAVYRDPKTISYGRWMGRNPYLESSFTGQPIAMLPPGAINPTMKKPVVAYPSPPVVDDAPRKWTEKKKKWRSRSTPRSGEIDELMGSSKTKAPNRLAIFTPGSPGPVKRQSRVEIYESEKRTVQKKGKFSLKNLFRAQPEMQSPETAALPNKFIDKEHIGEILERQKVKTRPEIIHPLDLLNGGVEVVRITPKNSLKGQFDKQKLSLSNSKTVVRTQELKLELKTKVDIEGKDKDSGHDTSSIHTETSEDTGHSSGSGEYSTGSDFNTNPSHIGMVPQPKIEDLSVQKSQTHQTHQTDQLVDQTDQLVNQTDQLVNQTDQLVNQTDHTSVQTHHISLHAQNSTGKPKPPPPPRSQSLDATFDAYDETDPDTSVFMNPMASASAVVRNPETVYANLGAQRSGLTPNKPNRTGSINKADIPAPPHPPPPSTKAPAYPTSSNATQLPATPLSTPPPPPSVTQSINSYIRPGKMSLGEVSVPSPNSLLRSQHSLLRSPHNLLRSPHNLLRSPHNLLRSPHNLLRSPNNLAKTPLKKTESSPAIPPPSSSYRLGSSVDNLFRSSETSSSVEHLYRSSDAIFHAKSGSMSESSVVSETMSESTLSCGSRRNNGSEADSERDSVSPSRTNEDGSPQVVRLKRPSIRRGRSIVHKNLEDNYGAVISANHEALDQILQQACENRPVPAALRPLAAATNLRFSDFSVLSESEGLRTPTRAFYPATWGPAHLPVTLMVSRDMSLPAVASSFSLQPIARCTDQVPSFLLHQEPGLASAPGVVWALTRTSIMTLPTFARSLAQRRSSLRTEELEKELSFILLQLINGLKYLEAQGTETVPADLRRYLLARHDGDAHYRLIITGEPEEAQRQISLCECALASMLLLFDVEDPLQVAGRAREPVNLPPILPSVSMYKTMATILQQDGSVALGQVKSMLEYMLWGTSDIIFELNVGREAETREAALQRWLDLERATVLNNMIRTQGIMNISLTVYQEYHLLFLVRTCAKMLREASLLFESEVSRM